MGKLSPLKLFLFHLKLKTIDSNSWFDSQLINQRLLGSLGKREKYKDENIIFFFFRPSHLLVLSVFGACVLN